MAIGNGTGTVPALWAGREGGQINSFNMMWRVSDFLQGSKTSI